jgi:hypothetical protein
MSREMTDIIKKLRETILLCEEELAKGTGEYFGAISNLQKPSLGKVNLDAKETMRISEPIKNLQKFREVFLYILEKVEAKNSLNKTFLHNLFYFIDFDFYEKYEEQFIGATYKKKHLGPVPEEFEQIENDMISKKEIEKVKTTTKKGGEYFRYKNLRKPNLDCLLENERKLIDEVLNRHVDKNSKQLSAFCHEDLPFMIAEEDKPLDYESVFYRWAKI